MRGKVTANDDLSIRLHRYSGYSSVKRIPQGESAIQHAIALESSDRRPGLSVGTRKATSNDNFTIRLDHHSAAITKLPHFRIESQIEICCRNCGRYSQSDAKGS
ncbi:MAG: hypothetical protein SynsKO_05810 [Synoicihabitans sp.]